MKDNLFDVYPTNGEEINKMTFTFHPAFLLNKMAKEYHSVKSDVDYIMSLTDMKRKHEILMHPEKLIPNIPITNDMILNYSVKKGFNEDLELLMSSIPEFELEKRSKKDGEKPKLSFKSKPMPPMSSKKKKREDENKINITPFPRKPLL